MKEKVANQGITQVLREDASPLWSELHRSSFSGEAHTALRGWRPISAALSAPVPLLFVRGRKTSLINHWASRPIYNRGSIRESVRIVKLIPSKNISIRLAMPLPVKILTAPSVGSIQHSPEPTEVYLKWISSKGRCNRIKTGIHLNTI